MIIKDKNTSVLLFIDETDSDIGLINDKWCMVHFIVKNDNFNYDVVRESITKNELINSIDRIKKFYNGETKKDSLKFIKNYFLVDMNLVGNDKVLIFKLIPISNQNKVLSYNMKFVNEEIEEFINMNLETNMFKSL